MSYVRDILLTSLACHSREMPRHSWRFFDLIADDAIAHLPPKLPKNPRLTVAYLHASLLNAVDRFKAACK